MALAGDLCSPSEHPALHQLLASQLEVWPEHEKFLRARFTLGDEADAEPVAEAIVRLFAGDVAQLCRDYRWLCDRVLEEELHFRRTGGYRLSSFADAVREVYANREFMSRYMNGLLLTQVFWANHTRVITYYARDFLSSNPEGYRHLEIGPGHGLLFYLAARDPRCARATAWDLSQASLDATRGTLALLGGAEKADLVLQDAFSGGRGGAKFESIVISEVCEHLEDPRAALASLCDLLSATGRVFVNMPINSPAPDHIFLLRTPEAVVELVEASGFDVIESRFFPLSGYTEARARKASLTMSCVVVGQRKGP